MNIKFSAYTIGLCAIITGCKDGPPTVNSINCSPPGMERILPKFTNEPDRQAFIDACNNFTSGS